MTIVIKKGESKEAVQRKIKRLQNKRAKRPLKLVDASPLSGMLKRKLKENAVIIQRKMRDEWR